MTGNFINYRGSTINWCPIGRQANEEDRAEWCRMDESQSIRNNWLPIARQGLDNANLEHVIIKLGGDTSLEQLYFWLGRKGLSLTGASRVFAIGGGGIAAQEAEAAEADPEPAHWTIYRVPRGADPSDFGSLYEYASEQDRPHIEIRIPAGAATEDAG